MIETSLVRGVFYDIILVIGYMAWPRAVTEPSYSRAARHSAR